MAHDNLRRMPGQQPSAKALSPREVEVLALAERGLINKEIAYAMGVSVHTVRAFKRTASMKLGTRGTAEAVFVWGSVRAA